MASNDNNNNNDDRKPSGLALTRPAQLSEQTPVEKPAYANRDNDNPNNERTLKAENLPEVEKPFWPGSNGTKESSWYIG